MTVEQTLTVMANHNPPTNGFKKGDPRINRKGRPKNFDALRTLAQMIATEVITSKDGNTKMSKVEMIMRAWSMSGNPKLQQQFIEVAYGKVPQPIDVTSKGEQIENVVRVIEHGNST